MDMFLAGPDREVRHRGHQVRRIVPVNHTRVFIVRPTAVSVLVASSDPTKKICETAACAPACPNTTRAAALTKTTTVATSFSGTASKATRAAFLTDTTPTGESRAVNSRKGITMAVAPVSEHEVEHEGQVPKHKPETAELVPGLQIMIRRSPM